MNKALIVKYYRMGIYTDKNLEIFVKVGFITADEMKDIQEG